MKKLNNFENFLNESLRDKMEGKSKEDLTKIFKEKYNIEYSDLEETVKLLNENGVICSIITDNYINPIEIKEWNIIRNTGYGQGWDIGKTITKELAEKIGKILKENMSDFWDKSNKEYYNIEQDSFSLTKINHQEALIILAKVKKS